METIYNPNEINAPVVKYAGFWIRFVASLIDGIALSIIIYIGYFFFFLSRFKEIIAQQQEMISNDEMPDPFAMLSMVAPMVFFSIIIHWLYYAGMESSKNQATLGKMALDLSVTDMNGSRISFARASGRYFGKILSGMILLIGYIMAGFTEKKQALHDKLAETLVIRKG
jgi:uncharacterized RDD family membrane protein YckC